MYRLKDPYEVFDQWVKYEQYETYIKNMIWITDGNVIEEWNSYKEIPSPQIMQNGNLSTYWMFPSVWEEHNPPLPPNQPERLSEKTSKDDAIV